MAAVPQELRMFDLLLELNILMNNRYYGNTSPWMVILTVMLYLVMCPAVDSLNGYESPVFHIMHSFLAAAIILVLCPWKLSAKPKTSIFSSILFILGALYLGSTLNILWSSAFDKQMAVETLESLPHIKGQIFGDSSMPTFLDKDSAFSILIIAPIVEEIIFRLGLMGLLMRFMNKPWALILSSAIFAAAHLWFRDQSSMFPLFILGTLLGLTYFTLGLGWAVALHFLWNLKVEYISVLLQYKNLAFALSLVSLFGVWSFLARLVRDRKSVFGNQDQGSIL